jgi:hypothetical protein
MLRVDWKSISLRDVQFSGGSSLGQTIIVFQPIIDELNTLQRQLPKSSFIPISLRSGLLFSTLPLRLQYLVRQGTEAHAPTFKYHNLDWFLVLVVHNLPLVFRFPVACARKLAFVVAGYLDILLAVVDGLEQSFAKSYIMS